MASALIPTDADYENTALASGLLFVLHGNCDADEVISLDTDPLKSVSASEVSMSIMVS